MAGEIGPIQYSLPASDMRAIVFNNDPNSADYGKVRDVVANAWDVFTDADFDDYDVALNELGTASRLYVGDVPTGLTIASRLRVLAFIWSAGTVADLSNAIAEQIIGASPADTTHVANTAIQQAGGYLRVRDASDAALATSAQVADIPTVAEFEARTLPSADYVVVGDTIAGVTTVGSVTGAVGSVTGAVGSVTGAVGSVTAGVTLADDAITAAKFDESTAFPVKSADTGATQIARTGADSDTLETLSDEIAAVKAETASILEDTGTTIPALIAATGLGAVNATVTVTDGTDPLQNAEVSLRLNGILEATGTTDASGNVTLAPASGAATYTVSVALAGYTFTTTTRTLTGEETGTLVDTDLEMTALSITASDPGFCTGYAYVRGADGAVEASATISCKIIDSSGVGTDIWDDATRTATSDANGLVEFTNLPRGARYDFWRGDMTKKVTRTIPDADTYDIGTFIGNP